MGGRGGKGGREGKGGEGRGGILPDQSKYGCYGPVIAQLGLRLWLGLGFGLVIKNVSMWHNDS